MKRLTAIRGLSLAGLLVVAAAAAAGGGASAGPAQEGDPTRRIAILEDTRSLGPKNELLGFLSHGDPRVRARACVAVGRVQAPEAISGLRGRLRDDDDRVRQEAVFALGQIALLHPEAFQPETVM